MYPSRLISSKKAIPFESGLSPTFPAGKTRAIRFFGAGCCALAYRSDGAMIAAANRNSRRFMACPSPSCTCCEHTTRDGLILLWSQCHIARANRSCTTVKQGPARDRVRSRGGNMNLLKHLFAGSAAGLFVVQSAFAADLPVKAKPIEYVKVCSAY